MGQEHHVGRLFDHVHLHVADLARSAAFYKAVLAALGKANILVEADGHFYADELFVDADHSHDNTRIHFAFQAADQEQVKKFHEAGTRAGGKDNGAPGPRDYHPGYYAAFVLDPDGNNVEAVYHGPFTRSAESVVVTAK